MRIHEEIQNFPAAIVDDKLTLVEHIAGEQIVVFTQQLGERRLFLGEG